MTITSKPYNDSNDHHKVMDFLRKTYRETGSIQNWLPPRFENNSRDMDPDTWVWEDDDQIIGFAIPESPLRYFCQLHPDYIEIYADMIVWIEQHTKNKHKERVEINIVELEGNTKRENTLSLHGYTRGSIYGIFRIRDVDATIPDYMLPPDFSVRSVKPNDYNEMASCIRQVFGHGDWFTKETLETISKASFYKMDLDLVVVDEQGKIVSFCTYRLDTPTGITELEPMGTLRDYRGKGIGRALICEGLRRLKKYHPSLIYIGGAANTPAANRLYEVTGFTEKHNLYNWGKTQHKLLMKINS